MTRHTPRLAERLDQYIIDQGDLNLTRAWFRVVQSERMTLWLYGEFGEVLAHDGFAHPARHLKSLKDRPA